MTQHGLPALSWMSPAEQSWSECGRPVVSPVPPPHALFPRRLQQPNGSRFEGSSLAPIRVLTFGHRALFFDLKSKIQVFVKRGGAGGNVGVPGGQFLNQTPKSRSIFRSFSIGWTIAD